MSSSREIAQDIMTNSHLFREFILRTRADVWKAFVTLLIRNFDKVKTEKEFLDVLRDIIDMSVTVRTGNAIADNVINMTKGMALGYVLKIIDAYCLDKWFGPDWFDRLRATAERISQYSMANPTESVATVDTLIDEDEVYAIHGA